MKINRSNKLMDIRLRIKELRISKKISQAKIAEYLKIDQSTYSDIENLKSRLSLDDFLKICKFMKIEPTTLIVDSDEIIIKVSKDQAEVLTELTKQINDRIELNHLHDFTINGDLIIGNQNKK